MRDRIAEAAKANNRSMNAEIVATLEEKYPAPLPGDPDETLETLPLGVWAQRVEYWTIKMGDIEQAAKFRSTVNHALAIKPGMTAAEFLDNYGQIQATMRRSLRAVGASRKPKKT
jgi:hypothetical protein